MKLKQHSKETTLAQTQIEQESLYPGLRPYSEDEKDNFFGRDYDCQILNDKILANRLTLLFAATGVGKSSLLQAAAVPQLKAPLGENLDVVYYIDWISNPLDELKQTVLKSLEKQSKLELDSVNGPVNEFIDEETLQAELPEFFEFCCLFSSQPLIIILDQFEEFFRYQRGNPVFEPFIKQLTALIINKSIPVSLVISMREDYALELNAFKPRLPMILFENYYRLEKLNRKAAEEAIATPAQRAGFSYEPKLFDQLLKDLLSRDLDRSKGSTMVADTTETVEPPYLQIICSQLWQLDQNDPDKTIRLKTYQKAGSAKGLLKNYIDEVQSSFSFKEKQLSSKAYDHLISRRGTKMAYTAEDLAQTLRVDTQELHQVFEKLTKLRVLRSQQREEKIWYELYHDMFSDSIEEWNNAWKNKMRLRRSRNILARFVLTGGALYIGYDGYINYTSTHLRMNLNDPYSSVELYQGKAESRDIFHQQKYLAQTPIQLKDREPDKRLPNWPVIENGKLNSELIGTLPLSERVPAFSENGEISRAIKTARDSIQDTDSVRSRKIINGLLKTQTYSRTKLLFTKLSRTHRSSLVNALQFNFSADSMAMLLSKQKLSPWIQYNHTKQKLAWVKGFDKLVLTKTEVNLLIVLIQNKDEKTVVKQAAIRVLGRNKQAEILPALILQLKDVDSRVRQSAVQALGSLGSKDALPALILQLKDVEWLVRKSVVEALGSLGSKDALPALILQLKDFKRFVRKSVVEALGSLGSKDALPALILQLKDDSKSVKSVAKALGSLGSKNALPALILQLKDNNKYVQRRAVQVLALLGSKDAVPALILQLKDDEWLVRKSVAEALGSLGSKDALSALILQLKDDEWLVRKSVAEALGSLGSKDALPALILQLKDGDRNVRESVAQALGLLGSEDALPALILQLKDGDRNVRESVAQALGLLGSQDAVPDLILQFKDGNILKRRRVAEALGLIGSKDALPALILQLKDEKALVRKTVAEALGLIGSKDALPALILQLKDDSALVRPSVAESLGLIGRKDALPALIQQLKDNDGDVRLSVAEALGSLGSKDALPALIQQLKHNDSGVRQSVAEALGSLGSKDALPALILQLKDISASVRKSVVQTLGSLGSKEALPALILQLKDGNYEVQISVTQALGHFNDPKVFNALTTLFQDEKKSEEVKATAAIGLLTFAKEENKEVVEYLRTKLADDFYIEGGIRQNTSLFPTKLQFFVIQQLAENPSAKGIQLFLELLESPKQTIPVQVKVIQALEKSEAQEPLAKLYPLLDSSFNPVRKAALQAITHLEHDKTKLLSMIENSEFTIPLTIPLRLKALTTLATQHKTDVIPELLQLLEKDESLYGSKIWTLLDKMNLKKGQSKPVEKLLHKQLETINQQNKDWREFRDNEEPQVAEGEQEDQDKDWIKWKEKLDKDKPTKFAFEYAHMLARIDPEFAIDELLGHNLESVRRGAWYGIASLGDVARVKQLTQQFLQLRKDIKEPLLRHAIYRTIDFSLSNIQINNQREDLDELTVWLDELKTQEDAVNDGENPVTQRVEWTIAQLDYHLNTAMPELKRRYKVFLEEQPAQ